MDPRLDPNALKLPMLDVKATGLTEPDCENHWCALAHSRGRDAVSSGKPVPPASEVGSRAPNSLSDSTHASFASVKAKASAIRTKAAAMAQVRAPQVAALMSSRSPSAITPNDIDDNFALRAPLCGGLLFLFVLARCLCRRIGRRVETEDEGSKRI